jgi:hypothetical protein
MRWPRWPPPAPPSPGRALKLIEVKYETLPHVIDVVEAMRPDAPLLHDDLFTVGVEPKPEKPSNIAKRVEIKQGDVEAGFKTGRHHRGARVQDGAGAPGLYRAACRAGHLERGRLHRALDHDPGTLHRARALRPTARARHRARYASPPPRSAAASAARPWSTSSRWPSRSRGKAKRPVKMVMSREEVFKASAPTSGATVRVKLGATKTASSSAAFAELKYQAGRLPGLAGTARHHVRLRPYDIEHVHVIGYDVVSESSEGRGLPRRPARRSRVRGGERGGRDRQEARHRPHRPPHAERGRTRAPRRPMAPSSGPSGSRRR